MSDTVVEIVTICTGNIARSPLAMALLEDEARRRLGPEAPVWVRSAGVHGLDGEPAVEQMREEAASRGLDLSRHRGSRIDAVDIRQADLLLTATRAHRDRLIGLAPDGEGRIFTMKEFARLAPKAPPPPGDLPLADRVRWYASHVHEMRDRSRSKRSEDVTDPYGGSREGYRAVAEDIAATTAPIGAALFGGDGVA